VALYLSMSLAHHRASRTKSIGVILTGSQPKNIGVVRNTYLQSGAEAR
jgi:hypothetical protein